MYFIRPTGIGVLSRPCFLCRKNFNVQWHHPDDIHLLREQFLLLCEQTNFGFMILKISIIRHSMTPDTQLFARAFPYSGS